MKISKLFHWLYALLMFVPFFALAFNLFRFGLSGSLTLTSFEDVISLITFPGFNLGSVSETIYNVYLYLVNNVFGMDLDAVCILIVNSLTYWTMVSIIYLIYDVIMYVPLLVHRWLDKGVVE